MRECPQMATHLLNYSLDLHLYLFGVVCHLLSFFNYIPWVNCWMNWISWSLNYMFIWCLVVVSHWFRKWNLLKLDNHNIGHTSNSWMISIMKWTFTYKYIILDIFYDFEYQLIIFRLEKISWSWTRKTT